MRSFKVFFVNGDSFVTGFNGTLQDARSYYVGKSFQFGDSDECPGDLMVKCYKVEELL